jgi:hypothetical protein
MSRGALRHRLVLDDHVDVHVGLGQGGGDAARDAGGVRDAQERHPGLSGRVGHGGDERMLHGLLLRDDDGARSVLEARAAVDPDPVVARVLDGAQLQDAGARRAHLEHLVERDDGELAGVGDDAGVRGEDARHVGVDLADVGADGGGERDRGGVRAAAPERRHVLGGAHALEAGDEHDVVLVERGHDPVGADVEDPRLRVRGVRDDPGLRAREGDRAVAEVVDRHRAQRAGHALARREEHVHLARVGDRETSSASAMSRSVSLPRAESTTTTRAPSSRLATMRARRA